MNGVRQEESSRYWEQLSGKIGKQVRELVITYDWITIRYDSIYCNDDTTLRVSYVCYENPSSLSGRTTVVHCRRHRDAALVAVP